MDDELQLSVLAEYPDGVSTCKSVALYIDLTI